MSRDNTFSHGSDIKFITRLFIILIKVLLFTEESLFNEYILYIRISYQIVLFMIVSNVIVNAM